MKRRRFIGLLGAVFTAGIYDARSQSVRKPARIGILGSTNPDASGHLRAAFKEGLRELGWVENRDAIFVERYAQGDYSRFEALAAELVAQKVDVVFASLGDAAKVVARVAPQMPVVFATSADPVGAGIVASLARPGGNITGFSTSNADLGSKRVQLLQQIRPEMKKLAYLQSATAAAVSLAPTEQAARELGLQFLPVKVERAEDIERAFESIGRWQADALVVPATVMLVIERRRVVAQAERLRLPAIYANPAFVEAGGLLSYTVDFVENYRRAAGYVDRILNGVKPADLPVEQPSKFELVLNVKAAKAIGIAIPPHVLIRANRVIS